MKTKKTRVPPAGRSGFTLIEIIVSLLLLAILTSLLGMGIVAAIKAYSVSRTNVQIAQKAQIATGRLTRELRSLTGIITINDNVPYLIYTRSGQRRAVAFDNGAIKLFVLGPNTTTLTSSDLADNGNILIDNINSFNLEYFQAQSAWDRNDIRYLSAIRCTFNLNRADSTGLSETFQSTVHPRNIKSYGGAPPQALPPTADQYCFVGILTGPMNKGNHQGNRAGLAIGLFLLAAMCISKTSKGRSGRTGNQKGSALLLLVAALVFFAALGGALVPLISSSGQMFVSTNYAYKAYLLAESGFRFAASSYLNAGSATARNDQLVALHQRTFTLDDNQGSFNLEIYGYYYQVLVNPQGTKTLQTRACAVPADDVNFNGPQKLLIGNQSYEFLAASTIGSNQVNFVSSNTLPYIPAGLSALPVADIVQSQQLSAGDDLDYESGDGRLFPLHNGQIRLAGRLLEYETNDRVNNRLTKIKDPNDPDMNNLPIAAGSQIVLEPFIRLESTGTYGMGQLLSRRKLVFHTPLPSSVVPTEKKEFSDKFEDTKKWKTSRWGSHQIQPIGDDNALKVTAADLLPDGSLGSLIELDRLEVPVDLDATRRANGGFLSYDTQVKIGFVETAVPPSLGYCPGPPLPCYFAAGLNFRLDEDLNSLGVSLLRARRGSPADGIDDAMVPDDDRLGIVLWKQVKTSGGFDRQWLAYKWIDKENIFKDYMESGANGWTPDGLWHLATHRYTSANHAWYYGIDTSRTYDTGSTNSGHLTSPEINLYPWSDLMLVFNSWHETETLDPINRDLKSVQVSVFEAGAWTSWTTIYRLPIFPLFQRYWLRYSIDLSAYAGKTIRIRFSFNTVDNQQNGYEGWYLDDIKITGQWPMDKSTLLVRLVEAGSLDFSSGTDSIADGDWIQGSISGATAIVAGPPHLESGTWNDGDAQGSLWLQHTAGNFSNGESILVVGKGSAAVAGNYRPRANFVRVFLGSQQQVGTPNSSPLDLEKHGNPRGQSQLNWPPDDGLPWTGQTDYFTLLSWDAINTGVPTVFTVPDSQYPECIIGIEDSLFFSTGSSVPSRAEIGLHAFGDGATNVYFDDFGLQANVPLPISIAAPIQQ